MSKLCEKPLLFSGFAPTWAKWGSTGKPWIFSFRHWLLVEPLEWNEIRISGDLSSPLTRNRLSLCRRLLPNGIIVLFFPRSSKKTDSPFSSFIVVGPSFTNDLTIFSSSRERARDYPFYRLRLLFTLKETVSLFYKAKQSAWRWSEESSINTHEHDAHKWDRWSFHKTYMLDLSRCFFGATHQPSDRWQNGTNK